MSQEAFNEEDLAKLAALFTIYSQETNRREPIKLVPFQQEIFSTILRRKHKLVHVMCPTQVGKSLTVALAVLLRTLVFPEKWAIIAPSQPKAMIIMRYIIEHCYDNEVFRSQLDMEEGAKERLKREVSKQRITFKGGGEIFVLSADVKNKAAAGEALIGFGSGNIILDESSLIDDDIYAKVFRMLGGHKDYFMLEIGNPFNRNHFLQSFLDDSYHKIVIDWRRAVDEGRLERQFVEEARKRAFFDVLYECKFPRADDVDSDGWSILMTEDEIKTAFRDENPNAFGTKKLGIDVARGGGNFNVWVLRTGNYAEIVAKTVSENIMEVIGTTRAIADKHGVVEENIFIDATGVGAAVYDRFREVGWDIRGVNMAEKAIEQDKYINIRAEAYFRLRDWIKLGGTLKRDNGFFELVNIRYKMRDNGKLKIIDKEALRKRGIPSPDVADALMLTFSEPEGSITYERKAEVAVKQHSQPRYD